MSTIKATDDLRLARMFVKKADSSRSRKIPFMLSFAKFKRLQNAKSCYYTGLKFSNDTNSPYYRTLERVDGNGPYSDYNVVACCYFANQAKNAIMEQTGLNLEGAKKMIAKIEKHLAKYGSN